MSGFQHRGGEIVLAVVIGLGFLGLSLALMAVWLAIRLNRKVIQWTKELGDISN